MSSFAEKEKLLSWTCSLSLCTTLLCRRLHLFTHVREKAPQGFLRRPPHSNTRRSPMLMAGICVQSPSTPPPPTPRLHHDTRIHTPLPPSAAIDSCAFNKSAEIQLLARSCAEKPCQLSRTGNCLSPCQGGNWIAGLRGGKCAHIVPLCT